MPTFPPSRRTARRRRVVATVAVLAALLAAVVFAVHRSTAPAPVQSAAGPDATASSPPASTTAAASALTGTAVTAPSPSPTTSTPASAAGPTQPGDGPCRPTGLAIPDLGVNASVVTVGLDANGNLGAPSDADKRKAGWFPSVLAGAVQGSVILSGHTYHDETAIFKTTFDRTARVGMTVRLTCSHGQAFSYRVTEAAVNLRPASFSGFVDSRRLYSQNGPPRVVIVTCTSWNSVRRDYDSRGVLIATPVS